MSRMTAFHRTDKRIEEISANVFDDAQDDARDHGAKDTVETTENGNRQTFEKQQRQRLIDTLNLAPDNTCSDRNN